MFNNLTNSTKGFISMKNAKGRNTKFNDTFKQNKFIANSLGKSLKIEIS